MKKSNDTLHPSMDLAKHFAAYRDEPSLLSSTEANELLAHHAMLRTNPPLTRKFFTLRRMIMTTTSILGLALLYFALHSGQAPNAISSTKVNDGKSVAHFDASVTQTQSPRRHVTQTQSPQRNATQAASNAGVWTPREAAHATLSLTQTQYLELPDSLLSQLGITRVSDTSYTYYVRTGRYSITKLGLSPRALSSSDTNGPNLDKVYDHSFYASFVTTGEGRKCVYINRNPNGGFEFMWYDAAQGLDTYREILLNQPSVPGLRLLGYTTVTSRNNGQSHDSIGIEIGRNIPRLPGEQLVRSLAVFSPEVRSLATAMALYAQGKGPKPSLAALGDSVSIKIDTQTTQSLLHELEQAEHSAQQQRILETFARLHDLIPVVVRPTSNNKRPLGSHDLVFWFRPTKDLLDLISDPRIAGRVSNFSIVHGSNFTALHAIGSVAAYLSAPDTLRVALDLRQKTDLTLHVQNLRGETLLTKLFPNSEGATSLAENIGSLDAGLYFVSLEDASGERQVIRIWKDTKAVSPNAPVLESHSKASLNVQTYVLSDSALGSLGLQSEQEFVMIYSSGETPGDPVETISILRAWGVIPGSISSTDLPHGILATKIFPTFVTDGLGRKRLFSTSLPHTDTSLEHEAYQHINELIPIRLPDPKNVTDSSGPRDLICWYQPTPEFMGSLPDSVRQEIARNSSLSVSTNRSSSIEQMRGAIHAAALYPNPSKGTVTVKVNLTDPRELTFTLRNLLGQQIAPQVVADGASSIEQRLDFSSVQDGIYLLTITSDKGEEDIERVVIAR